MRLAFIFIFMFSALMAPDLGAQDRHRRNGFWAGAGVAAAAFHTDCPSCTENEINGPGAAIRIGGSPAQNILLGGEVAGWSQSASGVKRSATYLSLIALWYPWAQRGLHVKFGVGVGGSRRDDGTDVETATGRGGSLGVGFDIRIARNVSLSPFVQGLSVMVNDMKRNGTTITLVPDTRLNLGQIGVAITWH